MLLTPSFGEYISLRTIAGDKEQARFNTTTYRMLRQEHVGVESAVRPSCRQHGPLVTDCRVVHDPHPPRRRAADDLIGLGVPNHARYAGIRGRVHL